MTAGNYNLANDVTGAHKVGGGAVAIVTGGRAVMSLWQLHGVLVICTRSARGCMLSAALVCDSARQVVNVSGCTFSSNAVSGNLLAGLGGLTTIVRADTVGGAGIFVVAQRSVRLHLASFVPPSRAVDLSLHCRLRACW